MKHADRFQVRYGRAGRRVPLRLLQTRAFSPAFPIGSWLGIKLIIAAAMVSELEVIKGLERVLILSTANTLAAWGDHQVLVISRLMKVRIFVDGDGRIIIIR